MNTNPNGFDHRSIKVRLWMYFMIFGLGVVALIWFLQLFFMNNYYEQMKIGEVTRIATSISHSYQKGAEDLTDDIQELSIINDFHVMIESSNGILLFSPGHEANRPIQDLLDETIKLKRLLDESSGSDVSFRIDTGLENYETLAYGRRITPIDGEGVYLYIFSPLYPVSSTINILRHQLTYVTIVTVALAFILSIYFAQRISKPIDDMTKVAKEISKGNYQVKFEGNSYSEINNLADTLNTAAYELDMADNRKKDLIANVSHDLKTPLTMIKSYAEMIRDLSGDIPEKRNNHLQVIIDETERLNRLVSDMSTVAAMQTYKVVLQRETFDLGASVNSILTPFNILEEQEGYRFKLTKPKECYAYGDEDKIKQVLSNLINNAVKYCGKDKVVIINIKRVGKKFRVEVSDHGPGISQKELPHVWDRYYKASSNYVRSTTGTGLGLSIVKEILTLHHADYGVNSRLGKGTTFWFELPLMKKDRDKEEERAKGRPMDPAVSEEIK